MSWLISLILAPWPDSNCPQPGCLDAVEAAQGCEDPLRGTETGMEAGQLRAEAQDVCHQLLEGPFRECHTQVWMGWRWHQALGRWGVLERCQTGPLVLPPICFGAWVRAPRPTRLDLISGR